MRVLALNSSGEVVWSSPDLRACRKVRRSHLSTCTELEQKVLLNYSVLLVGGRSSRFYPLGSKLFAQFGMETDLPILGKHSLFQTRLMLFAKVAEKIVVVGGREFESLALEQSNNIGVTITYLVEEERRDTAPAFLLALSHIQAESKEGDPLVVLSPSDHFHGKPEAMVEALREGARLTKETGKITTFVVDPRSESEAFSYLVRGEDTLTVKRFIQKPSSSEARELIEDGAGWGLGVHIGTLPVLMATIRSHAAFHAIDLSSSWLASSPCLNLEGDILCHLNDHLVMVDCTASNWTDLGTVEEVCKLTESRDELDLCGDVTLLECHDILRMNRASIPIVLLGLSDMVVALSSDMQLLVAPQGQSEQLKAHLAQMTDSSPYVVGKGHVVEGELSLLSRLLVFGDTPVTIGLSRSLILIQAS